MAREMEMERGLEKRDKKSTEELKMGISAPIC